jgi:Anti-sigma-K factor rskA
MVDGKEKPNDDRRSGRDAHEEFLELCAVSTSGDLNEEEQRKLHEHLAICPKCRQATKQFQAVVDQTIPDLASQLAVEPPDDDSHFQVDAAEASFFKRLAADDKKARNPFGNAEPWLTPLVVRRSRKFRRSFWLPLAAGLLLCASLGILTYRVSEYRAIKIGRLSPGRTPLGSASSEQAPEITSRDRNTAANAQLAERDQAISKLRSEIAQEKSENMKLTKSQSEQQLALLASDEEKQQLAEEREQVARLAAGRQEELEASEKELARLERTRSEEVIRTASLEAKIGELSRALKDRERIVREQEELLSKDRDIRELMGARDLYVAEVRDVAGTGETEKAFGRMFYTKGKSLIFYAYDLNDQPGLKEASTFQAWGRQGPDRTQAVKLGMLYEDNVSKKRWVLKLSDRKTLEQIDAVFVTVEPRGGSERPTGKPLLFAYLKVAANHP